MPDGENELLVFPVPESTKSRVGGKLRYWFSLAAAATLLLTVGLPSLLFVWLIRRRAWLYPIALWGAKAWLRASGAKVSVKGAENVADNRSYVFASNHRSYLDTAALFASTCKRIGLVAKKELLRVPVMGQGMGFVNIIAIDRSDPEHARLSMEKARRVIEDGYSFGVFVEGTRALPGELLPFKKGAFHLAAQTGVDIIPVAIKNTDAMMGKRTGVSYPGTVELVMLEPVETRGREIMDVLTETREKIAAELAK